LRVHGRGTSGRRGDGSAGNSSIRQWLPDWSLSIHGRGHLRGWAAEGARKARVAGGDGRERPRAGRGSVQLEPRGGAGGRVAAPGDDPLIRGVYFYRYRNTDASPSRVRRASDPGSPRGDLQPASPSRAPERGPPRDRRRRPVRGPGRAGRRLCGGESPGPLPSHRRARPPERPERRGRPRDRRRRALPRRRQHPRSRPGPLSRGELRRSGRERRGRPGAGGLRHRRRGDRQVPGERREGAAEFRRDDALRGRPPPGRQHVVPPRSLRESGRLRQGLRRVGDRRGDRLLPPRPPRGLPLRLRAARDPRAPPSADRRLPRPALRGLALLALPQQRPLRSAARAARAAAPVLPEADASPRALRPRARIGGLDRGRPPGLRPGDRGLSRDPLMRIGIYAPNLASPAPSGVERYITELLRALSQKPTSHEFCLISDAAELPLPAGGRRVPLKSMGRFARLRFDHYRLAALAREEKLDLLHCTKSFVPAGLDCPSIASIYDVIFLKRPEFYPFGW